MGIDRPEPSDGAFAKSEIPLDPTLRLQSYEDCDRWIAEFQSRFSTREEAGKAIVRWLSAHTTDIATALHKGLLSQEPLPYREFARHNFLDLLKNDYGASVLKGVCENIAYVCLDVAAKELPTVQGIEALKRWQEVRVDGFLICEDILREDKSSELEAFAEAKYKEIQHALAQWCKDHKEAFLAEIRDKLSQGTTTALADAKNCRYLIGATVPTNDGRYPPAVSQDVAYGLEESFSQHLRAELRTMRSYEDIHRWVWHRKLLLMDLDANEFMHDAPDSARQDLRAELVGAYLEWWDAHGGSVMREILLQYTDPSGRSYGNVHGSYTSLADTRRRLRELMLPEGLMETLIVKRRRELGDTMSQASLPSTTAGSEIAPSTERRAPRRFGRPRDEKQNEVQPTPDDQPPTGTEGSRGKFAKRLADLKNNRGKE